MDISELNLSVREFNAVKRFGINTTEELIERLPEFCRHSKKAGAAVTEQLHKLGLLPFHLGEWVEPERCGDELLPEEFREGEFVIMGFPTESRDWRKVVLIIKIDGTEMYFIDDKRDLMHHTIGDRKCWRIAGERGQAPAVPELEALGVPKFDRDILANYEVTSLDELKQHLHSLCRACPGAVREVYTALQEAGQVLFVPGDEPEDTALIGEEISFTELEKMVGEPVIYAPSEYDEPCAVLITRVLPGTVWLWGDLRNPYSITEKDLEEGKVFRIKNPQSGTENKEENHYGNTEHSGNDHVDADERAADDAAERPADTRTNGSTDPGSARTDGSTAHCAEPCTDVPDSCSCCSCGTGDDTTDCTNCDSRRSPVRSCAAVADAAPDACLCTADAGADSSADVHGGAARSGSTSAGGERQAGGTGGTAGGVRRAVSGGNSGEPQGGLCSTPESDGRADLMPDVHAKRSPSHAAIWSVCTASLEAEAGIPDKGSAYAAEGTLAHAIAELKVLKKFTPMPLTEYKNKLGALKADPLYQPEMDGYTDQYVEEITKVCHGLPSKPYVVAEKRLHMEHIVPDCFGTADCIVICGDALHVFDFKYGKGVLVSADHNPQMRLYALGAVKEYALLFGEPKTVTTHIIQPRLDNFDSEEMQLTELTGWGDDLKRKIEDTAIFGFKYVPGEHCRFCKARSVCRARAEALLTLEEPKARQDKGETLTDDEIGSILLRAQELANWVKGLEDYAQDKLLHGGEIPGWKLVEGRSVRTITDTDKAFEVLTGSGYDADLLYERKPLGLTALEKLCGKKQLTELIGTYIQKPAGKPTLAPESDKRKPYSKKKLEEMFKEGENHET